VGVPCNALHAGIGMAINLLILTPLLMIVYVQLFWSVVLC